ncbi:hypothetical protein N4P33_03165 [Streptomyces sp. 15-116A]|uniref:hypothetical protein n=1 Tax=Streptomyces sp. 15-116A TaxID=2259035 RepID=UPI0021B19DDB|nr:hypothetical protein [Streptomyces sp. 15-116A]MCT7351170.1 hypothetical protein [Streptomyces sp. 15-116A]
MPGDQDTHPFEERLSAALHDTGGTFEADRGALAAAGESRGRRMRTRRRVVVLGGVAGIAAIGVGGTLLMPGGDGGRASVASSTPSAASSPATATATATDSPTAVTGDQLLRTLKDLLPAGEVSGEEARGTDAQLGPHARVVFDDGDGAAAVAVGLYRVEPGSTQARETTTCPDKVFVDYDSCTTRTLADGSRLMLLRGYEYPDRREDTKWWAAELVTPEGQHVSVSEWNAAAQKGAPVSRPEPPLSPSQLEEVATAPQWRDAIDAIPEPAGKPAASEPPSVPPPGVGGTAVREKLVSLLPEDLKVVSHGGQETEYAYVVVDDGKGASFVQINVQPGSSDLAGELFGSAETLPDGTKVTTRQGPGEKGAEGVVMWTVDTLGPDGLRVVVSAFNSGAQHENATRDTPALSMKELRAIALDSSWHSVS